MGPGDTLVAPMNALHAFHNRTDKPSRFISSSVYYHEVFFETYAPTVDVDDHLGATEHNAELGTNPSINAVLESGHLLAGQPGPLTPTSPC